MPLTIGDQTVAGAFFPKTISSAANPCNEIYVGKLVVDTVKFKTDASEMNTTTDDAAVNDLITAELLVRNFPTATDVTDSIRDTLALPIAGLTAATIDATINLKSKSLYLTDGGISTNEWQLVNESISGDANSFGLKFNNNAVLRYTSGGTLHIDDLTLTGGIDLSHDFSIKTVGSSTTHRNNTSNGYSLKKQIFFQYSGTDIFAVNEDGVLQSRNGQLSSVFSTYSDDRLKHNEVNIIGLDVVRRLQPQKYQKTSQMLGADFNGDLTGYNWVWESGFIAQDVKNIDDLSFAVSGGDYYDDSNNLIENAYSVDYNSVFTYTTAAVKELDVIVSTQKITIDALNQKVATLETTVQELADRVAALEAS